MPFDTDHPIAVGALVGAVLATMSISLFWMFSPSGAPVDPTTAGPSSSGPPGS